MTAEVVWLSQGPLHSSDGHSMESKWPGKQTAFDYSCAFFSTHILNMCYMLSPVWIVEEKEW